MIRAPIVLILEERKWWLPVVREERSGPSRLLGGPEEGAAAFYTWSGKEGPDPFLCNQSLACENSTWESTNAPPHLRPYVLEAKAF